jgi:hypothetical protein
MKFNILKNKKFQKFINSNFVAKFLALITFWIIALIPFYLYLFVRSMLEPAGFWQEIALIAVCSIAIGWIQGVFLFIAILTTFSVISDNY